MADHSTSRPAPVRLGISPDGHHLVDQDGRGFFYLADTAWELIHRLSRPEVERYLSTRARQGFMAIQTVILAELDGLRVPNAEGHRPLVEDDPDRPDERFFSLVDFVVQRCGEMGLVAALLPTWGDKVHALWGSGPEIFSPEYGGQGVEGACGRARRFGLFLGRRYREAGHVIWVLGGDRRGDVHSEVWRAMAEGLKEGGAGAHLCTYHPGSSRLMAENRSAAVFHDEPWLDFNMMQSSHGAKDQPNYAWIEHDYSREPSKPCMDAEPPYEGIQVAGQERRGRFDDFDVRQAAWWAVLAGACGHAYGCNEVWQMWDEKHPLVVPWRAAAPWHQRLEMAGARQMKHLRALVESRPMLTRRPNQAVLACESRGGEGHIRAATFGRDCAVVYTPCGDELGIDADQLDGEMLTAWWFDPRTGKALWIGQFSRDALPRFTPPGRPQRGNDWVLVVDDARRGFPPPGQPS